MDKVFAAGVVLFSQPLGEYDKRLVILTRERGKITAFAHGARRQNSPLLAATGPFVFAKFTLYEGKNAYNLVGAEVSSYFTELAMAQPGVWLGFYFLELASYFGQEGIESSEMVNLLFVALRAILKGNVPLPLLRRIFELRVLVINGEYAPPDVQGNLDPDAWYALRFAAGAKTGALFSFSLSERAGEDFAREVERAMRRSTDRKFKSLATFEEMMDV